MPYPKMLTAFGKTQSMADWAREKGLPYTVLKDRMRTGWSVEEALTRAYDDGTKVVRSESTSNGKGQPKFSSYVGQTIGRLTIDEYVPGRKRDKVRPFYRCTCSCGKKHEVTPYALLYGNSRSCGCLASEGVAERNRQRTVHGMSDSPEYKVWAGMIQRCHNPDNNAYAYYGARGLGVDPSWRASFDAFISDMGPRPEGMTLERVDNAKGYSKLNCVWASRFAQQNNTRGNVRLTVVDSTRTISEWSRELSVPRTWIEYRLRKGLTMAQIIEQVQIDKAKGLL